MRKYKYAYQCPDCGTQLELKMRITQTKRRCPQCALPITPEEIDRQEAERLKEIERQEAERLKPMTPEEYEDREAEQRKRQSPEPQPFNWQAFAVLLGVLVSLVLVIVVISQLGCSGTIYLSLVLMAIAVVGLGKRRRRW